MTGSGGFCLDSEPCGWTLFSPGPGNLQNIDRHVHYSYSTKLQALMHSTLRTFSPYVGEACQYVR